MMFSLQQKRNIKCKTSPLVQQDEEEDSHFLSGRVDQEDLSPTTYQEWRKVTKERAAARVANDAIMKSNKKRRQPKKKARRRHGLVFPEDVARGIVGRDASIAARFFKWHCKVEEPQVDILSKHPKQSQVQQSNFHESLSTIATAGLYDMEEDFIDRTSHSCPALIEC